RPQRGDDRNPRQRTYRARQRLERRMRSQLLAHAAPQLNRHVDADAEQDAAERERDRADLPDDRAPQAERQQVRHRERDADNRQDAQRWKEEPKQNQNRAERSQRRNQEVTFDRRFVHARVQRRAGPTSVRIQRGQSSRRRRHQQQRRAAVGGGETAALG